MSKRRTQTEIDRMTIGLIRQKEKLPVFSAFGTPNHEIIDGQLAVLDGEISDHDEIYARYGGDSTAEDYDPDDDAIANEVSLALDWLEGKLPDDELVDEDCL